VTAGQDWNAPGDLATRLTRIETGGVAARQLIPADGQFPAGRRFHGTSRRLIRG
jgi:hypothetical protein